MWLSITEEVENHLEVKQSSVLAIVAEEPKSIEHMAIVSGCCFVIGVNA